MCTELIQFAPHHTACYDGAECIGVKGETVKEDEEARGSCGFH